MSKKWRLENMIAVLVCIIAFAAGFSTSWILCTERYQKKAIDCNAAKIGMNGKFYWIPRDLLGEEL